MSDFYPTWLYFSDLKLKQPSKFTKKNIAACENQGKQHELSDHWK